MNTDKTLDEAATTLLFVVYAPIEAGSCRAAFLAEIVAVLADLEVDHGAKDPTVGLTNVERSPLSCWTCSRYQSILAA